MIGIVLVVADYSSCVYLSPTASHPNTEGKAIEWIKKFFVVADPITLQATYNL